MIVFGEMASMGWFNQLFVFLFLVVVNMICVSALMTSHATALSVYPLNEAHRDGTMVRIADVDLDLEYDDSADGSLSVEDTALSLDGFEPGIGDDHDEDSDREELGKYDE